MGYGELLIRSYDEEIDRTRVEELERRCEVGPAESVVLFIDTMGDPICRIRNSPMYMMLVAELGDELVGAIQGSIKLATLHKPPKDLAKVGYVLGLRVAPLHRRKGIGLRLVRKLEEWFNANGVDYAYMATEKDNEASVKLFVDRLGYIKFRTPTILVNPVNHYCCTCVISKTIEVTKLRIEEAESLYRKFMAAAEFFPNDIGNVLRKKPSLGTWVAYPRGESWDHCRVPSSWAMVSVWNSGELFKMRIGNAPPLCKIYMRTSEWICKMFPCFKLPLLPDFFRPFGFYFMYGLYHEGPLSGKMVRRLCQLVHDMARKTNKGCIKAVVTEVGGSDTALKLHVPHWKSLSCAEDLWCLKALKDDVDHGHDHEVDNNNNKGGNGHGNLLLHELTKTPPKATSLFVDPREV